VLAFSVFTLGTFSMACYAEMIELAPISQGFYIDDGYHREDHPNYVVEVVGDIEWRNFFVFDLTGIDQEIVSAKLQLYTWENRTNVTYSLNSYGESGHSIADLIAGHDRDQQGEEIFADLGDGEHLGAEEFGPINARSTVGIALTDDALSIMNRSNDFFALGGIGEYHDFVPHPNGPQGAIFGFSGWHSDNLLILETIPEPSSACVLTLGLACATIGRRRTAL